MICSVCKTVVPRTMSCGSCRAQVCRGCKISPNSSSAAFALDFGAYCSTDCRDGQEVQTALAVETCPQCRGIPLKRDSSMKSWESACQKCYDTGIYFPRAVESESVRSIRGVFRLENPCPVCAGQWQANTTTCTTCCGTGIDPEYKSALDDALASLAQVRDEIF